MEHEDKKKNKKNIIEKILDNKKELKELELKEKKRKEEEQKHKIKLKIIYSILLGIVGSILFAVGNILGEKTGNSNSSMYALSVLGLFPLISIPVIWISDSNNINKK